MGSKILIADDNQKIREVVIVLPESEGYEIEETGNGEVAVAKVEGMDLIILDVMMPKMDGFKVCRQIREATNAPILFLVAKTMGRDKALGFSNGGDNYLAKPLSYNELITRMKILLCGYCTCKGKEELQEGDQIITHDPIVSRNSNQAEKKEEAVNLTEMEYQVLLLLADYPKKTFSNQKPYEAIWKGPYMYSANNTIVMHIRNLCKRLGVGPQNLMYIKAVWGKGYRFD